MQAAESVSSSLQIANLNPPGERPDPSRIKIRPGRRSLTPRQLTCLKLVAQGKTDREIGVALGISPETVHKHIEAAKKRYGVQSRIQLVLRAIWKNQLSLTQIVRQS